MQNRGVIASGGYFSQVDEGKEDIKGTAYNNCISKESSHKIQKTNTPSNSDVTNATINISNVDLLNKTNLKDLEKGLMGN